MANEVKKHIGVYSSMDEFNKRNLQSPWVAYILQSDGSYGIIYSNDETQSIIEKPDMAQQILNRLEKLESDNVYLLEEEYDKLVTAGGAGTEITDIDGTKRMAVYDPEKTYNIYEI